MIVWKERFNCHTAVLAPGLELEVNWSVDNNDHRAGTPYIGRVFGMTLRLKFKNLDTAKAAVINKARHTLAEALAQL